MKHLILSLSGIGLLLSPFAAFAASTEAVMTTSVNDAPKGQCLFKGSSSAVYAPMPDGSRRVFPNAHTWTSWYVNDISCIQTVTDAKLADMPLSGLVTVKPGSSLLKLKSDPRVYAIEAPNILRWITSEAAAKVLYGDNWQNKVTDIDETFIGSYRFGAPIIEQANYDVVAALSAPRPWDVTDADRPVLRIISRPASNLAELGLTVPKNATVPTSIVDVSVREEDRTALALCDKDCEITVQLNAPVIFQAMVWMEGTMHVSNKISIDPGATTSTQP